jgi:hypothetical protein
LTSKLPSNMYIYIQWELQNPKMEVLHHLN